MLRPAMKQTPVKLLGLDKTSCLEELVRDLKDTPPVSYLHDVQ